MALPFATRTRYCPSRGNTRFFGAAIAPQGAIRGSLLGRLRWRCHSQPERAIAPHGAIRAFLAQLLPRKGQYAALRGYLAPTGRNTPRFLHATRRSR